MRPRVSLSMIVRDEERNLAECLAPVADLFDEVLVVDTGSTDHTREIAAQFGARVCDFAWADDFAAARNEGIDRATGEWLFWLDADDRIDALQRERLVRLLDGLGTEKVAYAMRCFSRRGPGCDAGSYVAHVRLFLRQSGLRWQRRVHEHVFARGPELGLQLQWSDVVIEHVGYGNTVQRRRKLHRDLRLLQLDYLLDPNDPITLFYLGWTHLDLGNLSQALRFLLASRDCNPRARKLYTLLAECYSSLGQPADAMAACQAGLALFPDDPELMYHRGRLLGELGDLAGAERQLLCLLERPPQKYLEVGVAAGIGSHKARFLLGLIYEEQRRYAEAEAQHRAALAECPESVEAWVGLCQVYLTLYRWAELDAALPQLARCPGGANLAAVLTARRHIAWRQFDAAQRLLEEVIAREPQMAWPRLVLADLLRSQGADAATLRRVQQEVLDINPRDPTARKRLQELVAEQRAGESPAPPAQSPPQCADDGGNCVWVTNW